MEAGEGQPMELGGRGAAGWRRAAWWLFGTVALFALLYVLRTFTYGLNLQDEGVAAMSAWRIAGGQLPHADFFEIIPPLSFLPTAAAIALAGAGVLSVRLPALALALILFAGVDRLGSAYARGPLPRAALLAYCIPWGVSFWPLPSHHWYATAFQLFAGAALLRSLDSKRGVIWAGAAGALCACACFSLQDQGGYLVILLPVLFFLPVKDRGLRRRLFTAWCAGGLLPAAAFALWLLPRVPPSALWEQWVLFPLNQYRDLAGHRLGITGRIEGVWALWRGGQWRGAPVYASLLTLNALWIFLLPFLSGALLLFALLRRWVRGPRAGLLAALYLTALATAAHRWSLTNIAWVAALFWMPLLPALGREAAEGRKGAPRLQAVVSLGLAALFLGFAGFVFRVSSPRYATAVRTPAGTLHSLVPPEGRAIQEFVDAVDRLVPQEEPVAALGFIPYVNYLSGRPNPTRYNFFLYPDYHSEAQAREWMGSLEGEPVRFVAARAFLPGENDLHRYLRRRYQILWNNSEYILLGRLPTERVPLPGEASPGAGAER